MDLTNLIAAYLRDSLIEKIRKTEDYQAAKVQRDQSEREFVMSLTRKQRAAFHDCVRKRDALTAVELAHFLEDCTLVVSGGAGER